MCLRFIFGRKKNHANCQVSVSVRAAFGDQQAYRNVEKVSSGEHVFGSVEELLHLLQVNCLVSTGHVK